MNSFLLQLRTELSDDKYKFLLVTALFTSLCLTSIITTFYMDEILRLLGFEGFPTITTPSARTAFLDFFGDQIFFGLLIMSLGSMGIFASDIESGAISFSLTRPISRYTYSLSKSLSRTLALTLPFLLASFIGWIYVNSVFETLPLEVLAGALFPLIILYFYMGFLTSFFSTRFSTTNTGLLTISVLIVQFTISTIEPLELLSPFALANIWIDILHSPTLIISDFIIQQYILLTGWMIIPLLLTLFSLDKRDL
ncbi:MAG: hypothetical protein ACXAB2_10480 [Candidatus Hodarchaeales archaeon]